MTLVQARGNGGQEGEKETDLKHIQEIHNLPRLLSDWLQKVRERGSAMT